MLPIFGFRDFIFYTPCRNKRRTYLIYDQRDNTSQSKHLNVLHFQFCAGILESNFVSRRVRLPFLQIVLKPYHYVYGPVTHHFHRRVRRKTFESFQLSPTSLSLSSSSSRCYIPFSECLYIYINNIYTIRQWLSPLIIIIMTKF